MSKQKLLKLKSEKLDAINKLKQDYQKKMREEGEGIIKDVFSQFFELAPHVEAVKWTQYTPYFNDGEACYFGVNDPYVKFKSDTPVEHLKQCLSEWDLYDRQYEEKVIADMTPDEYKLFGVRDWDLGNSWSKNRRYSREVGKTLKSDEEILELVANGGDHEDGFHYSLEGEAGELLSEVGSMLSSSKDLLEMIFGDHVEVTVTREGIDVKEYNHD